MTLIYMCALKKIVGSDSEDKARIRDSLERGFDTLNETIQNLPANATCTETAVLIMHSQQKFMKEQNRVYETTRAYLRRSSQGLGSSSSSNMRETQRLR